MKVTKAVDIVDLAQTYPILKFRYSSKVEPTLENKHSFMLKRPSSLPLYKRVQHMTCWHGCISAAKLDRTVPWSVGAADWWGSASASASTHLPLLQFLLLLFPELEQEEAKSVEKRRMVG